MLAAGCKASTPVAKSRGVELRWWCLIIRGFEVQSSGVSSCGLRKSMSSTSCPESIRIGVVCSMAIVPRAGTHTRHRGPQPNNSFPKQPCSTPPCEMLLQIGGSKHKLKQNFHLQAHDMHVRRGVSVPQQSSSRALLTGPSSGRRSEVKAKAVNGQ